MRLLSLFVLVVCLSFTACTSAGGSTSPPASDGSGDQSDSTHPLPGAPPACSDQGGANACGKLVASGDGMYASDQDAGVATPSTGVLPYPPLLTDEVRLDVDDNFLRPVVPAWRTTVDGRVAMAGEFISALRIEALNDQPISRQDAGVAPTLFGPGPTKLREVLGKPATETFRGNFICEDPSEHNPQVCDDKPAQDCYRFHFIYRDQSHADVKLVSIPLLVHVKNPKTADAAVADVRMDPDGGPEVDTRQLPGIPSTGEMLSTYDGRVAVFRIHTGGDEGPAGQMTYQLNDGGTVTNQVSLAYAFSSSGCDVNEWTAHVGDGDDGGTVVYTSLRPIPAAPFDHRLRDADSKPLYGLAARPLRGPNGEPLGEEDVLAGAYPWLDREGNNLFFSTVDPVPIVDATHARFPMIPEGGGGLEYLPSAPRGFAVVGSWTQGKAVMLDDLINNEDFGFDVNKTQNVRLYQSDQGPVWVKVNGGSNNGVPASLQRQLADGNDHEIESLENNTAMHTGTLPGLTHDVVWTVTRGLSSSEIAFDDYLNPNLVLLAQMNASWAQEEDGDGRIANARNGDLQDGFTPDGTSFNSNNVRLQNAATSPIYPLADVGTVIGARVEPVALGGIRGRGLWLDPGAQAQFPFPDMKKGADRDFSIGLFIDSRDPMVGLHHLFTLAETAGDTLTATIQDGAQLQLWQNGNPSAVQVDISTAVKTWLRTWHQLAFLFDHSTGKVTVFVDGNAVNEVTLAHPISLKHGVLSVGGHPPAGGPVSTTINGIRGWYDEVRVELNGAGGQLNHAASVELFCNAAHGSMVEVDQGSPAWDRAGRFPYGPTRATEVHYVHPLTESQRLLCYTDYSRQLAPIRSELPAGTTSLRDEILLEGTQPLYYANPRPDSQGRSFCLSCHVDAGSDPQRVEGLTLSALTYTGVPADLDYRTQPMQPPSLEINQPAKARGNIPQGWITTGGNTYPDTALKGDQLILDWLLRP